MSIADQAVRPDARYVIVNGDDFGRSQGVNEGIVRAHRTGVVTSASMMVRWPEARAAADLARENPGLAVGLHVDLSEWRLASDQWTPVYQVVDDSDAEAVRTEVLRQADLFVTLMGRPPTHVDSHQHVHRSGVTSRVVDDLGRSFGVPIRERHHAITHVGSFYGRDARDRPLPGHITPAAMVRLLDQLRPGVSEVACHPGSRTEPELGYARERVIELDTLCSREVRDALAFLQIELVSFADEVVIALMA